MNFPLVPAAETPQHELIRVAFGYHMMARNSDFEYEYVGYDKSWSDMQKML